MNTINLKFNAKVKKVDVAFERATSDDQRNRALDVTLTGTAPGMLLSAILAAPEGLINDFWTEDGRPALAAAGLMKSTATFSDCQVTLGGTKHSHAKLRNFSFSLGESHSVALSFIVRFVNLDEKAVGHICGLFDEITGVEIHSAQMDVFDESESEDETAKD